MKVAEKISENILDKLSIDFLRNQVLKNAYGNDDTIIAAMDPRMLIAVADEKYFNHIFKTP